MKNKGTFYSYREYDYFFLMGKTILIRAWRGNSVTIPYNCREEENRIMNLRANGLLPEPGDVPTSYDVYGNLW